MLFGRLMLRTCRHVQRDVHSIPKSFRLTRTYIECTICLGPLNMASFPSAAIFPRETSRVSVVTTKHTFRHNLIWTTALPCYLFFILTLVFVLSLHQPTLRCSFFMDMRQGYQVFKYSAQHTTAYSRLTLKHTKSTLSPCKPSPMSGHFLGRY